MNPSFLPHEYLKSNAWNVIEESVRPNPFTLQPALSIIPSIDPRKEDKSLSLFPSKLWKTNRLSSSVECCVVLAASASCSKDNPELEDNTVRKELVFRVVEIPELDSGR